MLSHHHSTVNVSPKGQIVIPKEFRTAIGLNLGAKIVIEYIDESTLSLRTFHSSIQDLFGLGKKLKPKIPVKKDDIGQLILAEDEKTKNRRKK